MISWYLYFLYIFYTFKFFNSSPDCCFFGTFGRTLLGAKSLVHNFSLFFYYYCYFYSSWIKKIVKFILNPKTFSTGTGSPTKACILFLMYRQLHHPAGCGSERIFCWSSNMSGRLLKPLQGDKYLRRAKQEAHTFSLQCYSQ